MLFWKTHSESVTEDLQTMANWNSVTKATSSWSWPTRSRVIVINFTICYLLNKQKNLTRMSAKSSSSIHPNPYQPEDKPLLLPFLTPIPCWRFCQLAWLFCPLRKCAVLGFCFSLLRIPWKHRFRCLNTHLHIHDNLKRIFEFWVLYPQRVLALSVSIIPVLTLCLFSIY